MRSARLLSTVAVLLVGACQSGLRTEIVVEVDSNLPMPAEMDRIALQVDLKDRTIQRLPFSLKDGRIRLPIRVGLLPHESHVSDEITVTAFALRGEREDVVVREEAIVSFLEGRSLLLRVYLASECRQDPCLDPTKTCTRGGQCVDKRRSMLPAFDGTDPNPVDASAAADRPIEPDVSSDLPSMPPDSRAVAFDTTRPADRPPQAPDTSAPDLAPTDIARDPPPDVAAKPDAPPETRLQDAALLTMGARCRSAAECQSGACVDGFCCSGTCSQPCHACDLAGIAGTCAPVAAGQDPTDDCAADPVATCNLDGLCDGRGNCRRYPDGAECAPASCAGSTEVSARTCDGFGICRPTTSRSCSPGLCAGSSCATGCSADGECQPGFFCEGNCKIKRAPGESCTRAAECASTYCADGVCCSQPCTQSCFSCKVAGSVGTCTATPAGEDPREDCPTEPASSCGRDGSCNGNGQCRLYDATTSCGTQTCTGGTEVSARTCNGLGTCSTPTSRDCGPYLCAGGACGTSCSSQAQCASGYTCVGSSCSSMGGPTLHWKLDEASMTATVAADSSGNGRNGTYTGDAGSVPPSEAVVPTPLMSTSPFSRKLTRANRHAVSLVGMPAALKPASDITISLWYRATSLDTGMSGAAELISGGNNYFMRVTSMQIHLVKRVSIGWIGCPASVSNPVNGTWHHVAGVIGATTMTVYYDGVKQTAAVCADSSPMVYNQGNDLYVGRNTANTSFDFEGNIDDVRIYTRVLSDAEITALSQGN